jgi:hypothetical protein
LSTKIDNYCLCLKDKERKGFQKLRTPRIIIPTIAVVVGIKELNLPLTKMVLAGSVPGEGTEEEINELKSPLIWNRRNK